MLSNNCSGMVDYSAPCPKGSLGPRKYQRALRRNGRKSSYAHRHGSDRDSVRFRTSEETSDLL